MATAVIGADVRAGFVSRLLAFLIDIAAASTLVVLTHGVMGVVADFAILGRLGFVARAITVTERVSEAAVAIAYFPVAWGLSGQSIGKGILGLRIVREDGEPPGWGQCVARLGGYWLSTVPLFAGFLWIIVDPLREGWHDKLAGTAVVYAGRRSRW
jgi:uncharacterized RDD family membrane protein YckC